MEQTREWGGKPKMLNLSERVLRNLDLKRREAIIDPFGPQL